MYFFRYFDTLRMTIDNALVVVEPKKDIFSLKLVKVSDGNPIWTFFTGPHPKYSRGGLNLLLELLHLPLQNCTKQFFLPSLDFFSIRFARNYQCPGRYGMKNVSMLVCQIFKFWLSDDFYPYILNSHFPQNAFYACISIYTSILIISQCTCKIAILCAIAN